MSVNGAAFKDCFYQQNKLWTAIDAYTVSHLHPASRPNSATLIHALKNSVEQGLPDIASSPVFGKFLALNAKSRGVKHALEVGTLGAYTSIWLATEVPTIHVTTLEINPKHKAVAEENLEHAGVSDRVDIRLGAGLESLAKLGAEIAEGKLPKLGLVYIDADKNNNWNYIDRVIEMCEPGACIFVDNMVQSGHLLDSESTKPNILGVREVVEKAGIDDRIDAVMMQTVCEKTYDGFIMAIVR